MKNLLKKLITEVRAARTIDQDPLQSFMFKVSISGLPSGVGFQKVGGLNREVAVVEYLENMYEHKHKLPGRESVGEIIQVCDRFGNVRREFQLAECWFSKYELADLDATSDDVVIETLTMQFEYFL